MQLGGLQANRGSRVTLAGEERTKAEQNPGGRVEKQEQMPEILCSPIGCFSDLSAGRLS